MANTNCKYCDRPNAKMHAVGRPELCYCDEWCYRHDLLAMGPAPFWAHIPGLRWVLKFFLVMALCAGAGCAAETIQPIGSTCSAIVSGKISDVERSTVRVAEGCSGVYIADGVVLTAAHCGNPAWVETMDRGQVRSNILHVPHPNYNDDTLANDVALIFLDGPLDLPIAPLGVAVEGQGLVQGYGLDEDGNAGALRERPVEILGTLRGMLATTGGSCYGDSGGPLYQDGAVVGIVTTGASSDCEDVGLYTSVADHVDWIKSEADVTFANGCN